MPRGLSTLSVLVRGEGILKGVTMKIRLLTLTLALAALVAAPAFAQQPELSSEPFVAVGVLDLVTHRDGQTIFGIGLNSGRIEVTCTATLRGASTCDALAERLLGSVVVVRGREILANGEHAAFRASNFQRVD